MTRRRTFCCWLLTAVVASASVSGLKIPKRDVVGTVADFNKKGGIVVLSDFQGWDGKQMESAMLLEKGAIRRWLAGVEKGQAAIYLKAEDMAGIRRGVRIKVVAYSYVMADSGNGRDGHLSAVYDRVEMMEVPKRKSK